MSKKNFGRANPVFSRDVEIERTDRLPNWLNDFAERIDKTAVKSREEDASIFDQISSIINKNKSKYSNVEEAVLDMQKRTGLYDYLKKMASHESHKLFETLPQAKTFIDNYINDRPGTVIEAVVLALENHFTKELPANLIDSDLRNYINNKILERAKLNPETDQLNLDIGKVDSGELSNDGSNDDAFKGLMPATASKLRK